MYTKDGSVHYQVRETQPLRIDYKGKYRITSSSAPVSRGVSLLALTVVFRILRIELEGVRNLVSVLRSRRYQFAYTQRTLLGDPDLVPGLEAAQDEWTKPDA
ncbi:hypothetical protein F5878DRAFT_667808 [Lentinula raphanica]|uniref:Uncharacterized protein n=1 Tax=Lentinula raphanica TaxID=153919 RepID=A0AA38NV50_9AGAR|nr:hypothetical protein F5878DRAFT_667808 [Lentinula raphanica]